MRPVAVIINTHTTRHLRRTLMGVAAQSHAPVGVAVSCDNDSPEVRGVVEASAREFGLDITFVSRASPGVVRLGQLRNNGARALLASGLAADALLVFLDGDCCPPGECMRTYAELAEGRDAVIGGRIMMTPEQTEAFDEGAVRAGRAPCEPSAEQWEDVNRRQRRYQRQAWMKRLGLVKPHKPKPVGGNHAVTLEMYRRINGADESFLGGFQEDDDLGRRMYGAGARSAVAVNRALVYHQWHESRKPPAWSDLPNTAALARRVGARCEFGLDKPFEQAPVSVHRFGGRVQSEMTTVSGSRA